MKPKIELEKRIIDLIREKMEERCDMNLSDWNQYQIIELWANRCCK